MKFKSLLNEGKRENIDLFTGIKFTKEYQVLMSKVSELKRGSSTAKENFQDAIADLAKMIFEMGKKEGREEARKENW